MARRDLFLPGGEMAMKMASNPTVLQVGDTVFAHAGIDMATVTCTCCLSQIQAHGLQPLVVEYSPWCSNIYWNCYNHTSALFYRIW